MQLRHSFLYKSKVYSSTQEMTCYHASNCHFSFSALQGRAISSDPPNVTCGPTGRNVALAGLSRLHPQTGEMPNSVQTRCYVIGWFVRE